MDTCSICGAAGAFEIDLLDAFGQRTGDTRSACTAHIVDVITNMRAAHYLTTAPTFVVDTL